MIVNLIAASILFSTIAVLMVLQRLWAERKLRRRKYETQRSRHNIIALFVLSMLPVSNVVIIMQLMMPDSWVNRVDTWFGK